MDLHDWMNTAMPQTVSRLETSILGDFHVETGDYFGYTGCGEIIEILDDLLGVIFPGCYGKEQVELGDLTYYLNDQLRHINRRLVKHLKVVFHTKCRERECNHFECDDRARTTLIEFVESLPEIRRLLLSDIRTARESDPAATSLDEIVLAYPFVEAIATHRLAHRLYTLGVPIIPRIMSERAHSHTGIDIHPGAAIEEGFFIDHGTGVVIGETCRIGRNVKIYQGVTLGALSPFDRDGKPKIGQKRHPDVEDNVIIYANATILGGSTVIGKGSVIGGNTWITRSVPPNSVVYRTAQFTDSQETRSGGPAAP
jgi:serine O-acetyltransferase